MTAQMAGGHARTGINPFLRAVAALSTLSGWIAAGMMLSAVFLTCQMIFVRFVLNQSTIWQTETVVYLMLGATLIGLSYVQRHRGHVNVDVLPRILPMSVRRLLAMLTLVLTIVVMAVMAFYGTELWYDSWSRNWKSESVWGVQLWIPYLAMPVGFCLFLLQLAADLFALVTGIDRPFGLEEER